MPDRDGNSVPMGSHDAAIGTERTPQASTEPLTGDDFDIYHVRRVVAGNPNTPRGVLLKLAEDSMPTIRQRVAENPKSSVELLVKLASDEHSDVRLAVAENANTPPDILALLADDPDLDVRFGVAEN